MMIRMIDISNLIVHSYVSTYISCQCAGCKVSVQKSIDPAMNTRSIDNKPDKTVIAKGSEIFY